MRNKQWFSAISIVAVLALGLAVPDTAQAGHHRHHGYQSGLQLHSYAQHPRHAYRNHDRRGHYNKHSYCNHKHHNGYKRGHVRSYQPRHSYRQHYPRHPRWSITYRGPDGYVYYRY